MNKLVSLVRNKLFGKKNVGIRLPVSFAIIIGFFADILSKISGKSLPVSSIRIKKFLSITQFETSVKKIKSLIVMSVEKGFCFIKIKFLLALTAYKILQLEDKGQEETLQLRFYLKIN